MESSFLESFLLSHLQVCKEDESPIKRKYIASDQLQRSTVDLNAFYSADDKSLV